jgi:transcriptional regulator of heat shock response
LSSSGDSYRCCSGDGVITRQGVADWTGCPAVDVFKEESKLQLIAIEVVAQYMQLLLLLLVTRHGKVM